MAVKCTNCGGAHPKWDCSKPTRSKESRDEALDRSREPAKTPQAASFDTPHKPKIGRPKTDFDRTEYQKLYMRDKATIKRLGLNCTVAEFRRKNAGKVG